MRNTSRTFAALLSPLAHPTLLWEPAERRSMRREFGNFSVAMRNSALAPSLVTTSMPCHRPGDLTLIARRAGGYPAVPLRHALTEHEIGWHPPLCVRILPADLLHQGRVVVGLARPLRKRGGTCGQLEKATTWERHGMTDPAETDQPVLSIACWADRGNMIERKRISGPR